jgi:broad specificity phosphatase PhoE
MSRLYLVRHGETLWNREGRIQGGQDVPLGPRGLAQAEALAAWLAGRPVSQVVSSDLVRARATAQVIGDRLGLPVRLDPDLREMAYGAWEGRTQRELAMEAGTGFAAFVRDSRRAPPGGESFLQVARRARRAAQRLLEEGDEVVAVAHGGSIRAILCWALGLPLSQRGRLLLDNGSVSVLEERPTGLRVRLMNGGPELAFGEWAGEGSAP